MVKFNRHLVPDCATIALTLVSISSGESNKVVFASEQNTAFVEFERLFSKCTLIAHPLPEAEPLLIVNASVVDYTKCLKEN